MRHLRSIFYALVLAPSIWVLSGVGFTHDLSSRGREFFAAESISGLLLLIFAGILYAILAFAPVSPAGPVLAGAAYLGVTIWAWQSPAAYAALWAPEVSKEGFDLSRPGYGLAALLAVPLLGTALSARRWARYEPPVLPIIGEIGRFRGAAKVAGIPVSIAETTVIRVGTPADRTEVVTAADRTVTMPAVPASAPAAPVTTSEPTVAIRLPEAEPTTVLATPSEKPAAEAGDVTLPHGLAVGAAKSEANGDEPTRPHGLAVDAAKSQPNGDEPTRPHGLVTPPGDVTEPLRLPTEPTALIPAQRQPPEIES
ncbi:hypothetical protein [Actinoplanes lobatus]|uniref:Uncharacterized protein n=1 Tax=Actinoplanes lobatus TaxID=113568 RepID=A0ABQ4A8T9_9ACTN|nr:hypothetical protein [Actinoplanes lobatus]GIE37403.1 hypothetical protein Alo02nite_03010 [Actinoplanes lobatus]